MATGQWRYRLAPRRSRAELCTYLLEPKNWLTATVLGIGWRADRVAGLAWGLLALLFAAGLPMLFIGYGVRRGRWTDRNVGARRPRLLVLAFIMASVGIGLILLAFLRAPRELAGYLTFMLVSVALLGLVSAVWKISIHCAVAAGSAAILGYTFGPPLLSAFALVAVLCWARVAMGDHTVAQVLAGAGLGAAIAAAAYTATSGFGAC